MRKLKVLGFFLTEIGLPLLLVTLFSLYLVWRNADIAFGFVFFIFKFVVDATVLYLWINLRGHQLFYYHNLGFTKRFLIVFTFVCDAALFMLLHTLLFLCL